MFCRYYNNLQCCCEKDAGIGHPANQMGLHIHSKIQNKNILFNHHWNPILFYLPSHEKSNCVCLWCHRHNTCWSNVLVWNWMCLFTVGSPHWDSTSCCWRADCRAGGQTARPGISCWVKDSLIPSNRDPQFHIAAVIKKGISFLSSMKQQYIEIRNCILFYSVWL